jgi:hypothetical protein
MTDPKDTPGADEIRKAFRVLRQQAWDGFSTLVPIISMVEGLDGDDATARMEELRRRYFDGDLARAPGETDDEAKARIKESLR